MKNTKAATEVVRSCIQLVRKGSFISVLPNIKALIPLAESRTDWLGFSSRAIIAETYDQLGSYDQAARWVTLGIGEDAVTSLKKETDRDAIRALAMLILQCAVSQFRQESGQEHGLRLLNDAIEFINANQEGAGALHIRSLLYFWRGRIHSTRYQFETAERDFQDALDIADRNLKDKLKDVHLLQVRDEKEYIKQVLAGNYVLATCLGFGLGQLRQLEGKLDDSLQFLRVAVPLFRGSIDFHRRGYAHLLMGIALRSRSRARHDKQDELNAADEYLWEAKRLFGGEEQDEQQNRIPPHHLHLARVYHQLALSTFNRVTPGTPYAKLSNEEKVYLPRAQILNDQAKTESDQPSCKDYRDPVLDYGIAVLHSLIETTLNRYQNATARAGEAIRIISARNLPKWLHGWAWVAKGMAHADQVAPNAADRQGVNFLNAEDAFTRVFQDEDVRATDRAAALLHLSLMYSKTGLKTKAGVHFDRAMRLVELSEHGWIKVLARNVGKELGDRDVIWTFNATNALELARNNGEPAWASIKKLADIEVRKRLLRLSPSGLDTEAGIKEMAELLSISRATLFNWLRELRDPDLKRSRGPKRRP